MNIFTVVIGERAKRDLRIVPIHIARKLASWIDAVGHEGLEAVRRIPGYHDEPLKGKRTGERSIRLSKAYRAIYVMGAKDEMEIVEIIEVNKHDY